VAVEPRHTSITKEDEAGGSAPSHPTVRSPGLCSLPRSAPALLAGSRGAHPHGHSSQLDGLGASVHTCASWGGECVYGEGGSCVLESWTEKDGVAVCMLVCEGEEVVVVGNVPMCMSVEVRCVTGLCAPV
jgi:hypothetical protein